MKYFKFSIFTLFAVVSMATESRRIRDVEGTTRGVHVVKTTTEHVPSDPEAYAPIIIGCIMAGILVFAAFIALLIYLKSKKEDRTISQRSSSERTTSTAPKTKPTARINPNIAAGDSLQKSSDLAKKPDLVLSEEGNPKEKKTSTEMAMQKRHKEYVTARNREHAEETKSSRFQKRKGIFMANEIEDEAFTDTAQPTTDIKKLDKVYFNQKENELYDLGSEIEEMPIDMEPSANGASSAESVMTAHLSEKVINNNHPVPKKVPSTGTLVPRLPTPMPNVTSDPAPLAPALVAPNPVSMAPAPVLKAQESLNQMKPN